MYFCAKHGSWWTPSLSLLHPPRKLSTHRYRNDTRAMSILFSLRFQTTHWSSRIPLSLSGTQYPLLENALLQNTFLNQAKDTAPQPHAAKCEHRPKLLFQAPFPSSQPSFHTLFWFLLARQIILAVSSSYSDPSDTAWSGVSLVTSYPLSVSLLRPIKLGDLEQSTCWVSTTSTFWLLSLDTNSALSPLRIFLVPVHYSTRDQVPFVPMMGWQLALFRPCRCVGFKNVW